MAVTPNRTALSRVAVWYAGSGTSTQKDLVLPTQAPIHEYISDVVDALSADHVLAAPVGSTWTLATVSGPLEPVQSLAGARIRDGVVLELRAVSSTERYRTVREDVVDAVTDAAASAGDPFDETAARRAGLVALSVGGVALCAAQWMQWVASGYSWWWVLAGGVGALVAFIGMWSAAHRYQAQDAATAWMVVWLAAVAFTGQLIPISERTGAVGLAHLMVSAVAVAGAAVWAALITGRHLAIFTAITASGCAVAAICAVAQYTSVAPSAIAAAAVIAGLIGLQNAPAVAASFARITLPRVPADGESEPEIGEISESELATVRRRARRAVQMTTGLIVAAAVTTAGAAVWTMDPHSYHHRIELIIVACVVVIFVTWGRTLSNALQAYWMFAGAGFALLGAATRLLLADSEGWKPVAVVGAVVAVLAVLVVIAILVTPNGVNPRISRAVEIFSAITLVLVYPLAAWVTGIFALVRDLRIG